MASSDVDAPATFNDLKETLETSTRDVENLANGLFSNGIRNQRDAERAKNEILDNFLRIRRTVIDSFDRVGDEIVRSVPSMSSEQQRDLNAAVDEVGGFVYRLTRLIEDVCVKVIDFFKRTLDRIQQTLNDLKQTIRECCTTIRNSIRE